jgi:predicted RNase H-like HicB family nuclease
VRPIEVSNFRGQLLPVTFIMLPTIGNPLQLTFFGLTLTSSSATLRTHGPRRPDKTAGVPEEVRRAGARTTAIRLAFSIYGQIGLKPLATGYMIVCGSYNAMSERTFTAVIHKEEDLFVAECPEVGTVSQGYTLEEAIANLKEATELYLEEFPPPPDSRVIMTTFEATYG